MTEEETMNTPNRKSETKQSWHTPQAYILRGSAAGGGTQQPYPGEHIKGTSTNESQKVQSQLSAS